jgi:hypothetical protein
MDVKGLMLMEVRRHRRRVHVFDAQYRQNEAVTRDIGRKTLADPEGG